MRRLLSTASAALLAVGGIAAAVAFSSGSSEPAQPRRTAARAPIPPASPLHARIADAREDCATRSEATFDGAFSDRRNLVVGPLVLSGGAYTDAATVRQFGGNKFPLLVKAGHTVTVRVAKPAQALAGLAYGPLPQGENTLRDTYDAVTFEACAPGEPSREYSDEGPSGSYADGENVTFWSGFVLTKRPACIPLEIFIDDEETPQRVGLALGRRCAGG